MLCGLLSETLKKKTALNIQDGLYGADMRVCIENDGPVTILLDSRKLF
jgi:D-tyrosyl-tRNA(Tyr) deacylase